MKNKKVKAKDDLTPKVSQPVAVPSKTIRNISLQTWTIPVKGGSVKLTPGASIQIPKSVIDQTVINLEKRRLISIS